MVANNNVPSVVILGATASGKTTLSYRLSGTPVNDRNDDVGGGESAAYTPTVENVALRCCDVRLRRCDLSGRFGNEAKNAVGRDPRVAKQRAVRLDVTTDPRFRGLLTRWRRFGGGGGGSDDTIECLVSYLLRDTSGEIFNLDSGSEIGQIALNRRRDALRTKYLREADVTIIVYDSSDERSVDSAMLALREHDGLSTVATAAEPSNPPSSPHVTNAGIARRRSWRDSLRRRRESSTRPRVVIVFENARGERKRASWPATDVSCAPYYRSLRHFCVYRNIKTDGGGAANDDRSDDASSSSVRLFYSTDLGDRETSERCAAETLREALRFVIARRYRLTGWRSSQVQHALGALNAALASVVESSTDTIDDGRNEQPGDQQRSRGGASPSLWRRFMRARPLRGTLGLLATQVARFGPSRRAVARN